MRSTAIVLSGFLSTAVLAHPFHMLHSHHKRDNDAVLTNSWVDDGVNYEEYTKTVVVNADGQPPAQPEPEPAPAPVVTKAPAKKPKKAPVKKPKKAKAAPVVAQEKIAVEPSEAPSVPVVAQPTQTPQADDNSDSQSSGGSCSGEAIGGSAWSASACSGGKTIVDQFNSMRAEWDPSLADHPYTWDSTLAQNSHDTAWAPDGMNKAETMGHKMLSGSNGQCIAGSFGGKKIFYDAAKMWMCEIKQGPFCDTQTYSSVGPATGHADIIKNTKFSKVGCYFMYKDNDSSSGSGMVVCDFA